MDQNLNYDEMSDMIAGMMQSIVEEYGDNVPDPSHQEKDPGQTEKRET